VSSENPLAVGIRSGQATRWSNPGNVVPPPEGGRMTDTYSGADLVRQALAAAKTPEEQDAVKQAVAEAALEILAQLHDDPEIESEYPDSDPIAIARELAIRELRAAAVDTTMRPPRVTHLSLEQLEVFEAELESARKRAANTVRRSLRPPPPG